MGGKPPVKRGRERMDLSQALQVWWVLPVATAIATVALSSGISGALFFSPFFLLVVGLPPAQAIGAGLMTELFGTSFGSLNYMRQRVIDYKTFRILLAATIPAAVGGAFVANRIEPGILQIVLGAVLVVLAIIVLYHSTQKKASPAGPALDQARRMTTIRARDGSIYSYRTCNRTLGMSLAGIGAFLTGLMSTGLPEITTTQLIIRCRIPPRVAVATAISILTVTVFFAAGVHALVAEPAWFTVVWSVPGVIIGAQIGPRLAGRVPAEIAERVLAGLFLAIGLLVIALRFRG
ncbi:MAG: sulfite exporter TauE/SafE family protein [Dehalococcoidia bacterium]